MGNNIIITR